MSGTALEVRDLRFRYPGGEPVLDGVSFQVEPGERLALLGANGTGKSTLLLHLNGLLSPQAGEVVVGGDTVGPETLRPVRARVGLVFQDPDDQLFLPSLLEDVAFGPLNQGVPPSEAEERGRAILETLGLEHAAPRAAHHLSGGEKRLASLATVLVLEPGVLVLDEPTASLDARARSQVVGLLAGRTETLLVATHDLDVAQALCTRALVLDAGTVAYDGSVSALLADDVRLRRYGLQESLLS